MNNTAFVRVTSWNLAGQEPGSIQILNQLFDDSKRLPNVRPDIQIVGLQETPSFITRDPWTENLSTTLSKRGYILFKRHNLSGIFLYIFILRELLLQCRDFETESVRAHLLKSKGGVSLRFDYRGTTFSITNSHLSAHLEELKTRITDYHFILDGTKFLLDPKTPTILDHDYSIWFGDLNFRLDEITTEEVLNLIKDYKRLGKNDTLEQLYKHDQLIRVKDKKLAFTQFNETLPKFMPTYKFKMGSRDEYDSSQRVPAWTDRILYRTVNDKVEKKKETTVVNNKKFSNIKIEQLNYDSLPDFTISDHKPIISMFQVTTQDPKELDKDPNRLPYEVVKFELITGWRAGQDGRLWYKISDELFNRQPPVLSAWDRITLYKSDFVSLDNYLTFIYPPNIARIAPRLDASRVPYLRSPSNSRSNSHSNSPSSSRRNSTSSISQATEAISLNSTDLPHVTTSSQSSPRRGSPGPAPTPNLIHQTSANQQSVVVSSPPSAPQTPTSSNQPRVEPIVEDGYKYFSVQFPDEYLIPGSYVAIYQKVTDANEFNVYGISAPFVVTS